jgi:hypothetical protein
MTTKQDVWDWLKAETRWQTQKEPSKPQPNRARRRKLLRDLKKETR